MKKSFVSLAVVCSMLSAPAFAWGPREQGILPGIAGLWVFQQLQKPPVVVNGAPPVVYAPPPPVVYSPAPVYVVPPTVYVYPTNVPVPPGMVCSLHSETVNGQVITGNYCHYR